MSHPKISVEYFDSPGRAELTRALLFLGKIPFEDIRYAGDQFFAKKMEGAFPLGQVPVLGVDGVKYPQSLAIARYAARLANLYPQDNLDALRADVILETGSDLVQTYVASFFPGTTPEQVKEIRQSAIEKHFPRFVKFYTDLILENQKRFPGSKFLIGDKLTVADVFMVTSFDHHRLGVLDHFPTTIFDSSLALVSYLDNIKTVPEIAAYLQAAAQKKYN